MDLNIKGLSLLARHFVLWCSWVCHEASGQIPLMSSNPSSSWGCCRPHFMLIPYNVHLGWTHSSGLLPVLGKGKCYSIMKCCSVFQPRKKGEVPHPSPQDPVIEEQRAIYKRSKECQQWARGSLWALTLGRLQIVITSCQQSCFPAAQV